jgi:hypothetical protein
MIGYLLFIPTVFILLVVWRWFRHYGSLNRNRSKDSQNVALIILGSGGHTMEMLKLMNGVCQRFSSRVYVTSDELSKKKVTFVSLLLIVYFQAIDFESSQNVLTPNIVFTTRSRHVGQSLLASILPTLIAFFEALWIVASKR